MDIDLSINFNNCTVKDLLAGLKMLDETYDIGDSKVIVSGGYRTENRSLCGISYDDGVLKIKAY